MKDKNTLPSDRKDANMFITKQWDQMNLTSPTAKEGIYWTSKVIY